MNISHLAELFAEAAFHPDGWTRALTAMADATGSLRGNLIGVGHPNLTAFNIITGGDETVQRLAAEAGFDPEVNYRVAASVGRACGEVVAEEEYAVLRERLRNRDYEEMCEEIDAPFGCQATLETDGTSLIGLALLRSRADGKTDERARTIFARLVPHVQAAVKTQLLIDHRGTELVRGALDALDKAAILIDPYGRVLSMTTAAERILARTQHLNVTDRILRAACPLERPQLDYRLKNVLRGTIPQADMLLRTAPEPPMRLSIQRLPDQEWNFGFRPRVMVVLHCRTRHHAMLQQHLQQEYGLTAAESDVALALSTGIARDVIAARRGASLGTVRQQVKSIFAKLGVHREAEFLALLSSLALR